MLGATNSTVSHLSLLVCALRVKAIHALRVYRGDDLLVSYGGETAKADAFAAHGADRVKFHWLRHFYASMLIHQNTPTQDITRLMGHASIQETERTYNFWLPKKQYDDYAANVVSEMKL